MLGINESAPGNGTQYSSPIQIPGTTWTNALASGPYQVGCVKSDGTLWTWGNNSYGVLGQNNQTAYSSPKQVGSDTNWATGLNKFGAGSYNFQAIKTDGTMWMWGSNGDGGLGQNSMTEYSSPRQIGSGTDWASVATHGWQAVKTDGTLWTNGRANYGQGGHEYSGDRSSPTQISSDATWDSVGSWAYGTVGLKGTLAPSQL